MPAMPRTNNKITKIAYRILGTPENMQSEKKYRRKRNKRLVYDETERVR